MTTPAPRTPEPPELAALPGDIAELKRLLRKARTYMQHRMTEHSGRFGEDCECGLRITTERIKEALGDR